MRALVNARLRRKSRFLKGKEARKARIYGIRVESVTCTTKATVNLRSRLALNIQPRRYLRSNRILSFRAAINPPWNSRKPLLPAACRVPAISIYGLMGRCIHHWDRLDTSQPLRGEARPSITVPD